ncbi:MAG: YdiU family protein [Phycisphaeraceae bacterium]|nr:YdiU family protein [Phycisphaeraceae bacterium]
MTAVPPTQAAPSVGGWRFDHSYARLPECFFERVRPSAMPEPRVVAVNHALASELGLDFRGARESELAALFAGQALPPGAEPIAQAYAGHQFGHFTMLGDGRAILLGEHIAPDGRRVDLHFKGSGRTAFSRAGDGRAVLGPMLREYIMGEAMHALGVPTTRVLAVVTTGEAVQRESLRPGAMLLRVASSHLRVGTFEFVAALRQEEMLRQFVSYAIERHEPELLAEPSEAVRTLAFLRAVMLRQASLVAKWQLVGFVHGVMNTDNMTISGETIDYGPCAFMDTYHRDTVFSSIDSGGRYAYGQQPRVALWNLTRFAETLLSLIDTDRPKAIERATECLESFAPSFSELWLNGMRAKLGLERAEADDLELVRELLTWMESAEADFTSTFSALAQPGALGEPGALEGAGSSSSANVAALSAGPPREWRLKWRSRLEREGVSDAARVARMQSVNPSVIPRNHRVEEVLSAVELSGDLAPLHALVDALRTPMLRPPRDPRLAEPPPPDCGPYRTFCGT